MHPRAVFFLFFFPQRAFALRHLFTLARPDYATLPQYKHTHADAHAQTLVHMGRELEGSLDYVGSGGQGGKIGRAHV